ncbi:MAG: RNB domain-containing ribonuclease [Acidobacteriota bacterium]|nr:RNB domain-containing ribonuclease [Acidobacteriota bacterium]
MAKTPYPQSDRDLLRRIERSTGGRAGYKQLIRELGLGGGRERRLLLEQLARMTARGDLIKTDSEQWALPRAAPEKTARTRPADQAGDAAASGSRNLRELRDRLIAGRLDLHRDGYGFVRPNGSTDRADDLFIPPTELNGAMQGDEVLVDEAPRGRPAADGTARRSGRIARVLTRRNPTVVGIFHYARSHRPRSGWEDVPVLHGNYVTPFDERVAAGPGGGAILIPEGAEHPTAPRTSPHRVLGEEAEAQRRTWSLTEDDPERAGRHDRLEGLAVDVEITDFPAPGRPARGHILEILGPPEAFGVDVEIMIRKHHLPHIFPANVLAEAGRAAEQTVDSLSPEDHARRRDFRGLPVVTIDGETARDFDDAVLVRPLPNGNHELQVHIADVSAYVRPGTDLDLEARLRGTSVYFPDRAVPMLPPQLSSGMCSLRPDEDRLVLSCVMEIDAQGEIVSYEVCEGIIRSKARLTYTLVQAVLDDVPADTLSHDFAPYLNASWSEVEPLIQPMLELALSLNRKRQRRGSIDFDLPEPVISFDSSGTMQSIVRSERGWSHRLIEEFMLSANECVATWIQNNAIPSIYRIHETPDPKRILDFEETASGFGYSLGFSSLPVKRLTMKADRRDVRRSAGAGGGRAQKPRQHEVPESIPVTPQMYQRLTAKIAGKPEERILSYLMLRSLKQARYSEKNEGHFALASPCYTHFTSPIRRYPDLIVHRLLRELLLEGCNPRGGAIHSADPQPWGADTSANPRPSFRAEPIPQPELTAIAAESSQAERRADDAERELMEWKKMRFMEDRVGEDFSGIILSCTKYGFFVELDDLFIEGLVPLTSLGGWGSDERFVFRDTDKQIVSTRGGACYRMGQRVHVVLDRIDRQQKRLQFALVPDTQQTAPSLRKRKKAGADQPPEHTSPNRSGKSAGARRAKPGGAKAKRSSRRKGTR